MLLRHTCEQPYGDASPGKVMHERLNLPRVLYGRYAARACRRRCASLPHVTITWRCANSFAVQRRTALEVGQPHALEVGQPHALEVGQSAKGGVTYRLCELGGVLLHMNSPCCRNLQRD